MNLREYASYFIQACDLIVEGCSDDALEYLEAGAALLIENATEQDDMESRKYAIAMAARAAAALRVLRDRQWDDQVRRKL